MNQPRQTSIVLYDDECSFCTFQARVITWLDWFNTVSLSPISNPRVKAIAPRLPRTDLLEAMHCVATNGRIHRGARCIRHISLRLPLAVPVALLLWVPGIIVLAEVIYRSVSRNRHVISRIFGCKGACNIMPARRRENESQFEAPRPH